MSEKFYVGSDITGFSDNGKYKPVSRVTLLVDDNNAITAGDDSGLEISASCPHATREMADALLLKLKGYQYQAYTADAANIDPAAELGDGVTVGGVYALLSTISDDGRGYADISAPGELEDEDEYPYESPIKKEIERNLATTRSLITKTSEEIMLKVEQKADEDDVTSMIKTALDGIELSVSSSNGFSTFKLMSDGVALSTQTLNLSVDAVNVTGKLTASQIDATKLKVSAANITGSLTIGQLPSSVATDDDIPTNVSELTNDSGYQTRSGVVSIIGGTVDADYINAMGISATELYGETVYLRETRSGGEAGYLALSDTTTGTGVKLYSYSGLELGCQSGSNVFITNNGRSGLTQSFIQLDSDGGLTLSGMEMILGAKLYGYSLPSGGADGQIFFLFQ